MRRLLQVLVGLAIGLVIAEAVFWFRDDGAFPHLNLYVADPELGVRLKPGATERVRFGGNPTSSVRINAQGYRGADWPSDTSRAIAIVGDSQVFGLGVEEGDTFAAKLAERTNRPVLNAGVPTLGPPELMQVAREIVAARKPKTLILTINMVNDLFEIARPNRHRHHVWDGWAVRIETAPKEVTRFPFRELIMRKSHLVYAVRRFTHEATAPTIGALPSEGSWRELAALNKPQALPPAVPDLAGIEAYRQGLSLADQAAYDLDAALVSWTANKEDAAPEEVEKKLVAASGNPGDIVAPSFPSESARRADFNFFQLVRAGRERRRVEADELRVTTELTRKAVEYRQALQRRAGDGLSGELRDTRAKYDEALKKLSELRHEPLQMTRVSSPLDAQLDELARLCQRPACDPVLLVLPVDLEVDDAEWRKYNLEKHDVGDLSALTNQLIAAARLRGIRAIDALPVLKEAEPGAFLHRDIHMTPKGHEAVAAAIADELAKPAPLAPSNGALAAGRTRVPSAIEFRRTPEIVVKGTGKAGCETVQIDEWLRVQCRKGPGNNPRHIVMVQGSGDNYINANGEVMSIVAPVLESEKLIVDLVWGDRTQRLEATRGPDGKITGVLGEPTPIATPAAPVSQQDQLLCACTKMLTGAECVDVYGSTRPECFTTYVSGQPDREACTKLVACAQGMLGNRPTCPEGTTLSGGTSQCFPLCSDDVACASGRCGEWPETRVCLGGT